MAEHVAQVIDFALAAAHVRRRRRVRFVEPAPALETWFPCARHHDGCRELVRAPGFCRACMTALSVARQAEP